MRSVIGRIDGLEGCYIVGWALPKQPNKNAVITILNGHKKILATARASRHRSDLAEFGLAASGFRVPLTDIPKDHELIHVVADGVELQGSPILLGPGRYDGSLKVTGDVVSGWVTERIFQPSAPIVRIVDQNGSLVCELQSQINQTSEPLFAPAQFSAKIPAQFFGRREIRLRAFANDVFFAQANCGLTVRGHLDQLSVERCAGWLLSPEATQRTFELEIYRDLELVATIEANLKRPDLQQEFPNCWSRGFDAELPAKRRVTNRPTVLSLRLAGSNADLFAGPFILTDFRWNVTFLRRAASLVNRAEHEFTPAERSVVQSALAQLMADNRRTRESMQVRQSPIHHTSPRAQRLSIIIPIYRDVQTTVDCIESVLAHRSTERDHVVLVNDCSPEPLMARTLNMFQNLPNVYVLTNDTNLGFIKSINRGLSFTQDGDVILLNSDTRVFPNVFDELCKVANSSSDIGTVTPLSNNATIFSYPHASLRSAELKDVSWSELAQIALSQNSGQSFDVPTAHGFCMLIRRDLLRRLGSFDE